MNSNASGSSKLILPVVISALIVFSAVGYYLYQNNSSSISPAQNQQTSEMSQNEAQPSVSGAKYQSGNYSKSGKYVTPGGEREIDVQLTLSDGVITDITVTPKAEDATSKRFQGEFEANYKTMVVGKNIDEIALTKVSGSSLTPKGFNDALEKIKVEAGS